MIIRRRGALRATPHGPGLTRERMDIPVHGREGSDQVMWEWTAYTSDSQHGQGAPAEALVIIVVVVAAAAGYRRTIIPRPAVRRRHALRLR